MGTKKAPPAVDRRLAQALDLFEKAVKAIGKKDYEKARDLLANLLTSHSDQRDLVERARAYQALCDRALGKRPSRPKTFDDLLHHGVYLHNRGEYADALKSLRQAAEIHPKNEHVLYCLAAAAAQAGDATAALKALRSAIVANPSNRAQARSDSDFDSIREAEEFVALVYPRAS